MTTTPLLFCSNPNLEMTSLGVISEISATDKPPSYKQIRKSQDPSLPPAYRLKEECLNEAADTTEDHTLALGSEN